MPHNAASCPSHILPQTSNYPTKDFLLAPARYPLTGIPYYKTSLEAHDGKLGYLGNLHAGDDWVFLEAADPPLDQAAFEAADECGPGADGVLGAIFCMVYGTPGLGLETYGINGTLAGEGRVGCVSNRRRNQIREGLMRLSRVVAALKAWVVVDFWA